MRIEEAAFAVKRPGAGISSDEMNPKISFSLTKGNERRNKQRSYISPSFALVYAHTNKLCIIDAPLL
jgi:hypothetical protein